MAPMDLMETGDGMSVEELRAWVYARVKAHAPPPPVTNAWPIRPPRRSKVKLYLAFAAGVVFGMTAGIYGAKAETTCEIYRANPSAYGLCTRIADLEVNMARLIKEGPVCGPSGTIHCAGSAPVDTTRRIEDCPYDQYRQKCLLGAVNGKK